MPLCFWWGPEKHADLVLLWPNNVIKAGQGVTQLLLLGLLSGRSITELFQVPGFWRVGAVDLPHEVRVHLLAQRLGIGPSPGGCVTIATVALCGGGVDQERTGSNESGEEVVTEL